MTEGLDERRALKLAITGTTAGAVSGLLGWGVNGLLGWGEERWSAEVIVGAERVPVA